MVTLPQGAAEGGLPTGHLHTELMRGWFFGPTCVLNSEQVFSVTRGRWKLGITDKRWGKKPMSLALCSLGGHFYFLLSHHWVVRIGTTDLPGASHWLLRSQTIVESNDHSELWSVLPFSEGKVEGVLDFHGLSYQYWFSPERKSSQGEGSHGLAATCRVLWDDKAVPKAHLVQVSEKSFIGDIYTLYLSNKNRLVREWGPQGMLLPWFSHQTLSDLVAWRKEQEKDSL